MKYPDVNNKMLLYIFVYRFRRAAW